MLMMQTKGYGIPLTRGQFSHVFHDPKLVIPQPVEHLINQNLGPRELVNLSVTSKYFHKLCNHNALWITFLKPEATTEVKLTGERQAKKLFITQPKNRIDALIPVDLRGRNYLRELRPLFNLSTAEIYFIEAGKMTVEQFIAMRPHHIQALNGHNIKILINCNKLTIAQLLEMDAGQVLPIDQFISYKVILMAQAGMSSVMQLQDAITNRPRITLQNDGRHSFEAFLNSRCLIL